MASIYVDIVAGDDTTGDGTSMGSAYKHISRALEDVTEPVTEETYIILKGDTTDPSAYNYRDDDEEDVAIQKQIEPGGAIIIQPDSWNETYYEQDGVDPLTGGTFDPTGLRPCYVPRIQIGGDTKGVFFRGVAIYDDRLEVTEFAGNYIYDRSHVTFDYCSFLSWNIGLLVTDFSSCNVYNCYFEGCSVGVTLSNMSSMGLFGDNYFKDCFKYALYLVNNCVLNVRGWDLFPAIHYTTKLYTTQQRKGYAAIKVEIGSTFLVGLNNEALDEQVARYRRPALVQIVSEKEFAPKEYYGVLLESLSQYIGSANTVFTGKDSSDNMLNEGKDTVPSGQQFVGTSSQYTLILE